MIVEIKLTLKQAMKLKDILDWHQDEGPHNGGWASDALCELRNIVDIAIDGTSKA